tara:strand:+ start:1105 stop:1449 length:345 start_codon:yes stop_codon:yes gene_type:complete
MNRFFENNNFFIISIGAIIAAFLRWQIDQIFIVNTLGCFLLGFVNALSFSKKYKLFLGFAFCGSLTTFSGWSFQLFSLIKQSFYGIFFLNIIITMILGIIACGLGHFLAKKIIN